MSEKRPVSCREDSIRQDLAPVVQALQQGLGQQLVSIVLFGSRARGDAKEESDWDLLVIAKDLPDRHFERYRRLKDIFPPNWRGRISVLAKTPDEFEAVLPSLYLEIALDGLILCDRQGYASNRLRSLRRLIQSKDLRRERRGDEFVWQWGTFPGFGWSLAWEEAA